MPYVKKIVTIMILLFDFAFHAPYIANTNLDGSFETDPDEAFVLCRFQKRAS